MSNPMIDNFKEKFIKDSLICDYKSIKECEAECENDTNKYLILFKIDEDILDKYSDDFTIKNWSDISKYQKLSEKFIDKYEAKVDWENICRYQKLSEQFIRDHLYYIDWTYISKYQDISINFIKDFISYIDWYIIYETDKIDIFRDGLTSTELEHSRFLYGMKLQQHVYSGKIDYI